MISKTKINGRIKQKTNSYLAEAIFMAKKSGNVELASSIAVPSRRQSSVNLGRLDKLEADSVIIPGKVLGTGEINRKMKIYALGFSLSAVEKLKKAGCDFKTIYDALKKGEKIKGEIIK